MGLFATFHGAVTSALLLCFWLSAGRARRRQHPLVPTQRRPL